MRKRNIIILYLIIVAAITIALNIKNFPYEAASLFLSKPKFGILLISILIILSFNFVYIRKLYRKKEIVNGTVILCEHQLSRNPDTTLSINQWEITAEIIIDGEKKISKFIAWNSNYKINDILQFIYNREQGSLIYQRKQGQEINSKKNILMIVMAISLLSIGLLCTIMGVLSSYHFCSLIGGVFFIVVCYSTIFYLDTVEGRVIEALNGSQDRKNINYNKYYPVYEFDYKGVRIIQNGKKAIKLKKIKKGQVVKLYYNKVVLEDRSTYVKLLLFSFVFLVIPLLNNVLGIS